MAAVLLSPLTPCLILAAVLATVVAVVNRDAALVVGLSFVAVLLGAGRGAIAAAPTLPADLNGQRVLVNGAVDDDPVERKTTRRLVIKVSEITPSAGPRALSLRLQATVYGLTPVHYGDLVLVSGYVQEPPRVEQFDYRAYLAEQGIAGVMPSARLIRVVAHPGDPFHTALFALRRALIDAVDRALPEPQAALVLGVVFGYRAALPPALQQRMIASGLIHIVVISGQITSKLMQTAVRPSVGRSGRVAPLKGFVL